MIKNSVVPVRNLSSVANSIVKDRSQPYCVEVLKRRKHIKNGEFIYYYFSVHSDMILHIHQLLNSGYSKDTVKLYFMGINVEYIVRNSNG